MTTILRSLTARQIIQALQRDGYAWNHSKGSHRFYIKGANIVTVPFHRSSDTFPPKTLASIIRQAGWTDDDLRRLKLIK